MQANGSPVRVGQLWRRRHDGRAFIPAFKVGEHVWGDRFGHRRSDAQLQTQYVQIPIDDGPPLSTLLAVN
jgi:hypothetical protein